MTERYSWHQPQSHRRKTPSFSSSLLDSILRSIDESNDGALHGENLRQQQVHRNNHNHDHDHKVRFCASEQKRSNKVNLPRTHLKTEDEHMVDQWMESHRKNNRNRYANCSKLSSDSSSSGTETPSTHRSLPNSFTRPRKTVEAVFFDDTQKTSSSSSSTKVEGKFMKSTKLRAMKIYGDLKKTKQPSSPGSRISAFISSLFASSTKKAKQQDTRTTCTSFSRSCMSKKQPSSSVKRSVRFYPVTHTVVLHQESIDDDERDLNSMPLPKYERRRFTEQNYKKNYIKNIDEDNDEDEDEDDLFELEIVGVGSRAYGQELPVFETTDLRKIRI